MSTNLDDSSRHHPSTYFADRSNRNEMDRLAIQDRLTTLGMGGVLPEQRDPTIFQRVLDVACGTGGWLIETAKAYPGLTRLVGIDSSRGMIEYARAQAKEAQVHDRVEFGVMDALLLLEFPQDYFDLANLRFAVGFMRTWDWPKLLNEMQRVTKPGGVIRLTEFERISSSGPSLPRILKLTGDALYNAGHLFSQGKTEETFSEGTTGVARDLERLLDQYGVKNIQTRRSHLEFRAGTPDGERFAEDSQMASRTTMPFIRKWGNLPGDYETLYQQMVNELHQPDHVGSWDLLTVWGTKSSQSSVSQPYV